MPLKKRTIRKITKKTVTRTVRRTVVRVAKPERLLPDGSFPRDEQVRELRTYTTDGRVVKATPLKPKGK
jgi:hypothetical protein